MTTELSLPRRLHLLKSYQDEADMFVRYIRQMTSFRQSLNILEAGCGNSWELDLSGINYTLTGVDLDQAALEMRAAKQQDLDHTILGDLRTVKLEENYADVIYNSFVLEHVEGADQVLDNFWRWLRPGGLLLLRIPNRDSVHGFLTRITPFWFHVLFKKYVEGVKHAGKPGFDPYPVYYDEVVSRKGIHRWCRDHGAVIEEEYGSRYYFDHLSRLTLPIKILMRAIHHLSFGRLACDHNNLTYVIRKPREDQAGQSSKHPEELAPVAREE